MKRLILAMCLAACTHPKKPDKIIGVPPAGTAETEERRRERLRTELADDILASYDRDDPPDVATDMVRAEVGGARIGFGPDDVALAGEIAHAASLWRHEPPPPSAHDRMYVDRVVGDQIRSNALRVQLAQDRTAAWVSDEISWRIPACGRTAVIPLRVTALFAHDGDRWIQVFEHVSFARPLQTEGSLRGPAMKSEVVRDVADELSGVLQQSLSGKGGVASDAFLLGPDLSDEWHGAEVLTAKIGATPPRAEERRVGTVGRLVSRATVAYWIGNFTADAPLGKVRLRGTFVFEKRNGAWQLVQGHLSEGVDDDALATKVFGTALVSLTPLRVSCP